MKEVTQVKTVRIYIVVLNL